MYRGIRGDPCFWTSCCFHHPEVTLCGCREVQTEKLTIPPPQPPHFPHPQADDADGAGPNSEVRYSMSSASQWSANFTVNSTTGVLRLTSPLDYEKLDHIAGGVIGLVVLATDRGSTRMTGSVNVTVTVQVGQCRVMPFAVAFTSLIPCRSLERL